MSVFLKRFELVSNAEEIDYILGQKMTCYNGIYPYKIFPQKEFRQIFFDPITIFYGNNGSGKSTLLNVIAEKIGAVRRSPYNGSAFFDDYVRSCKDYGTTPPKGSFILTSDDVFHHVLNVRCLNNGIDLKRDELFKDFLDRKYSSYKFSSMDDYDEWRETCDAKTMSKSKYVSARLMKNEDMFSNGENAIKYFTDKIEERAIYILDEPENSLSIPYQLELSRFLVDSARFFKCQLIIATHSPILLSMDGARIYDLDEFPVITKKWTDLQNVREYYEFFKSHSKEFEND